jgi:hypothetical protein
MSATQLTEDDQGKRVVSSDGEKIGMISEVRGGTAYVDPDPGMFDTIKAKLGWEDVDEDSYPLQRSEVSEVTDDEIRLRRF